MPIDFDKLPDVKTKPINFDSLPDAVNNKSDSKKIESGDDRLLGAGEAILSTGTGLVGGAIGQMYGAAKALAPSNYGTVEGSERAQESGGNVAQALTYQPRTSAGQRYTENIGDAIQASGIAGIPLPELGMIGQSLKPIKALAGIVDKPLPKIGGEIVNPRARELNVLGKEHGVNLTYGQESGKVPAQRFELGMKHIPFFGTEGKFESLQKETTQAARNFVGKFQKGEDYGNEIHESLNRGLVSAKGEAKTLYDDVETKIKKEGVVDNVEPTQFKAKTTELLKEYPDIFNRLPDESLQKTIASIQAGVERKKPESTLVSIGGSRIKLSPEQAKKMGIETTGQTGLTFKEARFLREKLSDYINRAKNSAGVVGNKEFYQLNQLKSAIDSDIETFGKEAGNKNVIDSFNKANTFYKENVVPFKDKLIDKATSRDVDTDTILKSFVKEDRPKLAKKLYDRLDEQGKLAIRYGILKEAFDRSFDERTENFQPGKFSDSMHKLADANEILFSKEEKSQIDGLSKLMKASEQAGNNQKITSRVESLTKAEPIGMAAAFGLAPIATLKFGVAAKSMAWLLTSERGKRLLTEVSKTPEQSARFNELVRQAKVLSAGEMARTNQNNNKDIDNGK